MKLSCFKPSRPRLPQAWNGRFPYQANGGLDGNVLPAIGAFGGGPLTHALKQGKPISASFLYDSGHGTAGVAFWEFTAPVALDSGAVGMVFGSPPQALAGFNGPQFSLTSSIDALVANTSATSGLYTESGLSFLMPPNPGQLSTLRNRGGKVLLHHGLSDAHFSADDTRVWLAAVSAQHPDAADFTACFPVPGMGHCSGGPATDQVDLLSPLVAWVEQGVRPERILASACGAGNAGGVNADLPANCSPARTRPLCRWPSVARCQGSGDLESAANFVCRP